MENLNQLLKDLKNGKDVISDVVEYLTMNDHILKNFVINMNEMKRIDAIRFLEQVISVLHLPTIKEMLAGNDAAIFECNGSTYIFRDYLDGIPFFSLLGKSGMIQLDLEQRCKLVF